MAVKDIDPTQPYQLRYFDLLAGGRQVALWGCNRCGTIVFDLELHEENYHHDDSTDEESTGEENTTGEGTEAVNPTGTIISGLIGEIPDGAPGVAGAGATARGGDTPANRPGPRSTATGSGKPRRPSGPRQG